LGLPRKIVSVRPLIDSRFRRTQEFFEGSWHSPVYLVEESLQPIENSRQICRKLEASKQGYPETSSSLLSVPTATPDTTMDDAAMFEIDHFL
jgi:hypothetical protein